MSQQIQERVFQIIAKSLTKPPENIHLTLPIEELCEDSLDLVSLVFALEDEFNLDLADKAKEAKTIQDIVMGIESLLKTQQTTEISAV
ncbi:acyl carrier protein [Legionella gratiana]|uniref:Acyl carrier protein n=1 Tax=Legionella gratiana TaxID=45066 RepID=A0A378JH34_9GAMM|nr:phosphopantetheine-binding protein [Legionella gratiana]KTD12095.1 acyl carrier protein [Legionella gratiana]STX46301.1 acyl carrier protein [Legionella gratiana]